jgi:hypothetical protein
VSHKEHQISFVAPCEFLCGLSGKIHEMTACSRLPGKVNILDKFISLEFEFYLSLYNMYFKILNVFMSRLAGVKLEKDAHGRVKKVTLDMKHHAHFLQDYLDALDAEQRIKNGAFISWDDAKVEIERHHQFKIG